MATVVISPLRRMPERASLSNALLRGLAPSTRSDVLRAGQLRRVEPRQVLFGEESPGGRIYFPFAGFTSLMMGLEDGTLVETASIGAEGMVGVWLALGTERHAAAAIVRAHGEALVVAGSVLRGLMERHADLRSTILRWTAALISDTEVTLGCMAHHSVPQRLARWIGAAERRVGGGAVLLITHEELAQCIGAQRPSVSEAALTLQRAEAIQYRRGQLQVTNAERLAELACGCNRSISWSPLSAASRLTAGRAERRNPPDLRGT